MSARLDIHRPSLADPADYSYVGCFYQGSSEAMNISYEYDHAELGREISRLGNPAAFQGNHERKSTCDHCGASFAHGVYFLHGPSQELVAIGHICATNTIGLPSKAAAAKQRAELAAAAEAERKKRFEAGEKWRLENPDVVEFLVDKNQDPDAKPHNFLVEMYRAMNHYGSLTDGQANAVRKFIASEQAYLERQAARANEPEVEKGPFPAAGERLMVAGKVISTKWKDSDYGGAWKMLVELDDGNRVWGTVPESLFSEDVEHGLPGMRVTFAAKFERSRDDEHFGFFSRPTKADVVE